MEIPDFFWDQKELLTYDYSVIEKYLDTDFDFSKEIFNLSPYMDKKKLSTEYFKSILLGYNHTYIMKLLEKYGYSSNICLPLVNKWRGDIRVDNLVIISHPEDAERICKRHIKKAPIFKSLLNDSIISTTDNEDWKDQRSEMNGAFLPKLSLSQIFPISSKRSSKCIELIKKITNNFEDSINMSDFFLNETQAQLQLAMFGFSEEFETKTNKRIRNVFSGIDTDYLEEFSRDALNEVQKSDGPASKLFHESIKKNNLEKDIGNIILFAFAGHDTTGHTLTWLLYELCKNPIYKEKLIKEIDEYWLKHDEPTYETFNELPYMTRCITETLRMWPALANGTYRELEEDEEINGLNEKEGKVMLKKGTYCQIINWTRHRNPELWEEPDVFNPEREFKDSEIWDHKGFGSYNVSSERYSPFTYGPRNCLGKNFSHMEMRLILLHLFKDNDFVLTSLQTKISKDPNYMGINTFTMGPASIGEELIGMYVNIIKRKSTI